jgi:hypothetical protein
MTRTRLIGAVLLFALAAGSQASPLKLGRRYKDESNGFALHPPSKWEQVPTKFQEVATVGKWVGRAKRGRSSPALLVLRFEKVPDQEAATPQDALKRGIPGRAGAIRFQPKDVWEYADRILGAEKEILEDDPDVRMSSKKFRAHMKVMRQRLPPQFASSRDADKYQAVVVAASIEAVEPTDATYGVVYVCTEADREDMDRCFELSIRRFRILREDEEDDEEEDASDADIFVDSEKKPEIWREARRRKLIPGWDAIDTENYLIVYNKDVKRHIVKKIAKHIEAIRAQVYEHLFPPSRDIKAVSVVRVCKDMAEYHRYGGPTGSAGYWSRGDEELVIPGGMQDSLRVLYHEAFHQYIHYAVGDVAPHSWFNEGHGDYFAGHNYSGGKFKPAPFRWRTGIIATAIGTKSYVPLKRFLKFTQGQYYATPGLCYAEGWSFVYFLREAERRKIKKYKQYWGLLDKYFDAIKRNVKSVKENALEGLQDPPPIEPVEPEKEPEPTLPRLPGLEQPFPGEHPLAGAGTDLDSDGKVTGRTVAKPKITGVKSALDAAVDEAFKGIDYEQLEKDWIEFTK